MTPKPTVGRIVHALIKNKNGDLVTRPAIIVRTWGESCTTVQAQVFTDGDGSPFSNDGLPNVVWKSSLVYDEAGVQENSWRWAPRE